MLFSISGTSYTIFPKIEIYALTIFFITGYKTNKTINFTNILHFTFMFNNAFKKYVTETNKINMNYTLYVLVIFRNVY